MRRLILRCASPHRRAARQDHPRDVALRNPGRRVPHENSLPERDNQSSRDNECATNKNSHAK
jgi:hypothetical protein